MLTSYAEWCENHKDIAPLVRKLKSSMPEQYIGFYLSKALDADIEYQKQFEWLGNYSLDIYVPALRLAIEYDGVYYHANKKSDDNQKTAWCRSRGVFLIHIIEKKADEEKSRKRNEIDYYYKKRYKNIDVAINELFLLINKKYNMSLSSDVDLERDKNEIISYVQQKFHERSAAYVWPETADYWLEEENGVTRFDVLSTDGRWLYFKCPHCGEVFSRHMRYHFARKSLIPCDCEYEEIERLFEETIRKYKENGEIVVFDDSLRSRRLFDRMEWVANSIWRCESKEEAELYKKSGFTNPYIDVYLEMCEKRNQTV